MFGVGRSVSFGARYGFVVMAGALDRSGPSIVCTESSRRRAAYVASGGSRHHLSDAASGPKAAREFGHHDTTARMRQGTALRERAEAIELSVIGATYSNAVANHVTHPGTARAGRCAERADELSIIHPGRRGGGLRQAFSHTPAKEENARCRTQPTVRGGRRRDSRRRRSLRIWGVLDHVDGSSGPARPCRVLPASGEVEEVALILHLLRRELDSMENVHHDER